jgi:hypothetical protein
MQDLCELVIEGKTPVLLFQGINSLHQVPTADLKGLLTYYTISHAIVSISLAP